MTGQNRDSSRVEMGASGPQLIAYADRFGGSLDGLRRLLHDQLAGAFHGVHVLPFYYPIDGADAGFDPEDHTRVDPQLGDWSDVEALAEEMTVAADLIVNHISVRSREFSDIVELGDASPHWGMILTMSSVFPHGAREEDLARIYRPRPGLPFTRMRLGGTPRLVWTTFTSDQLDLNIDEPLTWEYLTGIIDRLTRHGVKILRLDAVGYVGKVPGTSCFMTDAAKRFIARLVEYAHGRGAAVLVELHAHYEQQIDIARTADLVYDFALPPLVLYAITAGDVGPLAKWLTLRPTNAVTVLDTHDGIGLVDVGPGQPPHCLPGLMTAEQMSRLVESIHHNSGGVSRLATGNAATNLDIYQVNCTFYDALGRDDTSYLLARALQLFLPGTPQVYYVGLLAGTNDAELLAATGAGRDVNRHYWRPDEIERELARPVVQAQLWLLRLRANHPAFGGEFSSEWDDGRALLRWRHLDEETTLEVDIRARSFALLVSFEGESSRISDVDLLRGLPSPEAWQTVKHPRRERELVDTDPPGR